MPQKVPKKNINRTLVDVKKPEYNYKKLSRAETVNLSNVPQVPRRRSRFVKTAFGWVSFAVVVFIIGALAVLFFNFKSVKSVFIEGAEKIAQNFSNSVAAIRGFKPQEASRSLQMNRAELSNLNKALKRGYGDEILSVLGNIIPKFKDAGSLIGKVTELNMNFLYLADALSTLQTDGFRYFRSDGEKLLKTTYDVLGLIRQMIGQIESIRNTTANLRDLSESFGELESMVSEEYIKYSAELHKLDKFLGGLLNLLSGDEKHVIVLFQNTSEIRPGGGFAGSYADVAIKNGQLMNIDVRDIYDPDGQLDLKVVPPSEIKTMSQDWGARDANWFFDFPTSARAVLYFLENSKMYSEKNITFDGVLGININVFESILESTGPVALEEYQLVLNKDNFLKELRSEIEASRDKKTGQPKRILKVLAPIVLERMQILPQVQLQNLVEKTNDHITRKDIMIYMKDQGMAQFIFSAQSDGGVYRLPDNFWGTYLAFVNANIAGGKTDVFMEEKIDANIDLDTVGGSFIDLSVTRRHTGDKEKDPWWRATNKNFVQVYTNLGSVLVSVKGNDVKSIVSNYDYDVNKYERYADLEAIENTKIFSSVYKTWTMQAFGKSVFGTWFNIPVGKEKTIEFRYQTTGDNKLDIRSGKVYTFIFEKQSGVNNALNVTINAPLGYYWRESKSPIFSYENNNLESRTFLYLTLER